LYQRNQSALTHKNGLTEAARIHAKIITPVQQILAVSHIDYVLITLTIVNANMDIISPLPRPNASAILGATGKKSNAFVKGKFNAISMQIKNVDN
jgi:hypothetical protein